LLLNSHSPVVLSALVDANMRPIDGGVLFADTAVVTDPERNKTRLRPVHSTPQTSLFGDEANPQGIVSDLEVRKVLNTVSTEG